MGTTDGGLQYGIEILSSMWFCCFHFLFSHIAFFKFEGFRAWFSVRITLNLTAIAYLLLLICSFGIVRLQTHMLFCKKSLGNLGWRRIVMEMTVTGR